MGKGENVFIQQIFEARKESTGKHFGKSEKTKLITLRSYMINYAKLLINTLGF